MECMTRNEASDNFCKNCRVGLGKTSSPAPRKTIRDEEIPVLGRPRIVTLLGGWVLFFPLIIGTIIGVIELILNWDDFGSYVLFLTGIAVVLLGAIILYNHTRGYLTAREAYQAKQARQSMQTVNSLSAKAGRQARMKKRNT